MIDARGAPFDTWQTFYTRFNPNKETTNRKYEPLSEETLYMKHVTKKKY